MVKENVIRELNGILVPVKSFIPSGAKLLYEQVIEPDEIPVFEGLYLLVKQNSADSRKFVPIKSLLVNLQDFKDDRKFELLSKVQKWLLRGRSLYEISYCDYLTAEELGSRVVFMPNRFPSEFFYFAPDGAENNNQLAPGDKISFAALLE